METLYPLPLVSTQGHTAGNDAITALVNRTVPSGDEETFLETLKDLLQDFDRFPGTSGSMVFRREVGGQVEFSILQRFARAADHDAWLSSPEFERWRREVAPPEPTAGHIHRYSGMDAFFVSAQSPDAPPRWKMALILMVAVYPMSLIMSHWFAPILASMPLFWGSFLTSVFMVFLMTYVLVPLLTKLFQRWLTPAGSGAGS
ncbi:MAG: antibiotic biosynthesis monooxygenase [Terrimicrobiaceae bacterium]